MKVNRRVTFKLYPNSTQEKRLYDVLGSHQRLYNAAIEERRVQLGGHIHHEPNPRHLGHSLLTLRSQHKALSRKTLGSRNRDKQRRKVAALHGKVARQRHDFHHKLSARLVDTHALIATEELAVGNMMARGGLYNAALNRSIADAAPAGFIDMLRTKAEEAGCQFVEVDTRRVKPSQTCSGCGYQRKKSLSERTHQCQRCGLRIDRDVNAARVMLNIALFGAPWGREPAPCGGGQLGLPMKHETPARARCA